MKKIIKKYKDWFSDIRIIILLFIFILTGILENGMNNFLYVIIPIVAFSIIFPPLTILIDILLECNKKK